MTTNKNVLINFKGQEVEVFEWEGKVLFNPKHVAECLDIADVNSSIRNFSEKQAIKLKNSNMHNMHFRKLHNTGEKFLTESGVYKLIFKSHKEEAEEFQDWVTDEVLPSIRKHGAYISDNEESVDQNYIKFAYGQLGKTFSECPIELLDKTYEECMNWHKANNTRIPYANNSKRRSDATKTHNDSKIMIMEKIIDVLENRNKLLSNSGKFGTISDIDKTIKGIKDDITKQNNLSNRGKLGGATKKINQLTEQLESVCPTC